MSTTQELHELPAQYDPGQTERAVYERWVEAGVFSADEKRSKRNGGDRDPFVIIMPPPNVTSVLHMGHGLNNTVQDVIIRWRRMAGDETLWVPGTDHAGIATQNIIEKQLAAEGKSKFDLGREAFVERTISFVNQTGGEILQQLRAIGASCDWNRTAYTLSPELSRAVREAFVQLHERGLIYRGHRVIHWCPRCLTSLSDEEAQHGEEMGTLYHIAYPLAGAKDKSSLTVATTRPETMLGDVAVAVHPDDERYKQLIGKSVLLPIANVEIPIIADEYVDPAFGTGVVKITPAHDPNDFEVGLRHKLPMPVIMAPDGTMANGADAGSRVPADLLGVDRFEARERIVRSLEKSRLLTKVEPHQHAVRHCYRCDTVVEPRLSDQWFVKMEPLAKPALNAVRDGTIRILPERWEAVYINWLESIRDWNISRQLWWGHRIPVWYCDKCSRQIVSRIDVTTCDNCGGPVRQDEDVLDTWFSSWLFPISTLGWPDESAAPLVAFYPTDDLVTAPEILFFWVARMVMAGYAFMEAPPFHTVYLHGTVLDTNHVKMSKSLGNGIDPLDVVASYGADALRYTVISGMGMGAPLVLDHRDLERSFAPGRNFATKLWNIGRFLLANVGTSPVRSVDELRDGELTLADNWILGRLNATIIECDAALGPPRPTKGKWQPNERYSGLRLSEYAEAARGFVWNDVADWYLETTKGRIGAGGSDSEVARAVLTHVFDFALRVLHPIMPFITETLWQRLPFPVAADRCEFLAIAPWPLAHPITKGEKDAISRFDLVREAVSAIRQIRSDYAIPPGKSIDVVIQSRTNAALFTDQARLIGQLARATIKVGGASSGAGAAHSVLSDGSEVIVPLGGLVDLSKECGKLRGELEQLETQLELLSKRLRNEGFISRAPAAVVESERKKEDEWIKRREQLAAKVKSALRRLIAAVVFGLACASPGMPPGGPLDVAAPQIVSIIPDSGSVGVKPKEVIFHFDEVVSERPPSVTTLADLFLISPRDGIPDVSWHRDAIAVKPTRGWRPNTPYTVIMMRGLADLRGNVRNTGATTFFSTGPTIPRTRISGHVFDWVTGTPANGALIESFVKPDSLHPYVALADSGGAFALDYLPQAHYTVRAYIDRNKNLGIDPSEQWDSVSVNLIDSVHTELLVFVHDSVPPRIHDVVAIDSLTLQVTFDKPVDPTQTLTAANFAIIGPDSAPVPIASAGPAPRDTTPAARVLRAPTPLRAPVSRRGDTTTAPKPVMARPAPISSVLIRLQHPLTPKVVYRIRAIGIRGLLGHSGDSERAYTRPPPPPPAAAKPAVTPPASPPPIKR